MKLAITFIAALVLCAFVPAASKSEDCPPGEVFIDNGNIICDLIPDGGNGVYVCWNDGACMSACGANNDDECAIDDARRKRKAKETSLHFVPIPVSAFLQ
jgi:hypothetical protein